MVWKDKEKKTTLFGKVVPKRIIQPEDLLKIDDTFYRSKIKPELDNCEVGVPTSREFFLQEKSELGINATEIQKVKTIFNLIKAKGKLGIEYNASKKIPPRTPDEVLKDKKADCDELSLTFLAVAERAGVPIEKFNFLVITFEVETLFGTEKEARHAAVLKLILKSDKPDILKSSSEPNKIYLLDFAMPEVEIVKLKEINEKSLNNVYLNKKVIGGETITGVKSYNIKEGKNKILSTFYEETANFYDIEKKEHLAVDYYEKAKELNSDSEPIITKLTNLCLHVARNKTNDENEQEKYFRKAVKYSPERAEANSWLGSFLAKQKRYKEAIVFLEKTIVLLKKVTEPKSWHLMTISNLANCLYSLNFHEKAEKQCLKVIGIANEKLKITPNNLVLLEPLCKANLILSAIYYKRGNLKKAKEFNSKALEYSKIGLGITEDNKDKQNYRIFSELKKTSLRNSKVLH